jgi:phosphoglycerate dehydrogenase-like enzyme
MPGAILVSAWIEERFGEALRRAAPGRPLAVLRGDGLDGAAADVEAAFFSGDLFPDGARALARVLHQAPSLRWLHTFAAGVDHPFFQRLLARGVRVTTSSGAAAVPIAHTVLLYVLALSRDLPGWARDQADRRWNPRDVEDLQGRRLVVLGLGPIGLEVARLAQALRMEVTGVRRTPRGDEPCETWPLARLDALLPRAEWLVLALPLADDTHHLLDARRLALLPRGARVVNVGRGALVDEAALADALASGQLAGAGLDVFEVEPLPPGSPLWSHPRVIVTPHASGSSPGNDLRAAGMFVENLGRFARGEPLRNEVPPAPAAGPAPDG